MDKELIVYLKEEKPITDQHMKNNTDVRKLLTDKNIFPENLPPAEDIKKITRNISIENKKLKNTAKLKDV